MANIRIETTREVINSIEDAITALQRYENACQLANIEAHQFDLFDDSQARELVAHLRMEHLRIVLEQSSRIIAAYKPSDTIEREPVKGAQAERTPSGDFLAYLGIDPFAELTEDASDAIDELYDEMTIFDYFDCNRYWNASLTEDDEAAIIERYADRIWYEDGTLRTC